MHFWIEKQDAAKTIRKFLETIFAIEQTGEQFRYIQINTSAGSNHFQRDQSRPTIKNDIFQDEELNQLMNWLSSGKPYATLNSLIIGLVYKEKHLLKADLERQAERDKITFDWEPHPYNSTIPSSQTSAEFFTQIMEDMFKTYNALPEESLIRPQDKNQAQIQQEDALKNLIYRFSESATLMNHLLVEKTGEVCDTITITAQKLRAETDNERTKLQNEYTAELTKLQQDREKFEAERKAFDDQKSTLIRRNLLSRINESLEKHGREFKLSKETYKKTWPIQVVCLMLALFAATGIYIFGRHILEPAPTIYHIIPFSTSILTLLSTSVFYTRWHNQWVSRHADLETRNQLLQYDMLRASWVAEFLLEYKDERGQGLPDSVIQVMTKNLFEGQTNMDTATHPAEDMASFIRRINRVRLGDGEVEFEANTKTASKKAKSSS